MPARSIASASITFGLVSIPVRLFPATSPKSVRFHLLHGKDNSRIQQRIHCVAEDKDVDRSELVRGYEFEKDRYVTFTDEELKALESHTDHTIDISEFLPLEQVDPVFFDDSYLLGCEPTSAKAYHLLAEAMTKSQRVGLAKVTMRGKEHLVLIRPYNDGLMLHTMYYEDEVRAFKDIDHAAKAPLKDSELDLAQRLIGDLTEKTFAPSKFKDTYRERVIAAAEQKLAGQEITEAPQPVRRGNVIDLMGALKESLKKRGVSVGADDKTAEPESKPADEQAQPSRTRAAAKSRARGGARRSAR